MSEAGPGAMGAAGTALLLLGLGGLLAVPDDWGFSSSEVVIPERLTPRGGEAEEPGRLSYLLPLEGRRHVLHLRPKKLLLPRRLPVFTFSARGELLEEQPYVPHGCYYRGAVEGAPDSLATFSTCSRGLWGMLRLQGRLYQVEPLPASATFEHRVSLLDDLQLGNWTCGLTDEEIARQMARLQLSASSPQLYWHDSYIHPKYVELAVAVDNARYRFRESNLSTVIQDTIQIVSYMDSYFEKMKAHVFLKALEVWTDNDKVNTSHKKLSRILGEFSVYQDKVLYPRTQHDFAHLFVRRYYSDAMGWAFVASACMRKYMASTSTLAGPYLLSSSLYSAHELGHGCGLGHDYRYCQCSAKRCIMFSRGSTPKGGFSNCSFNYFFNFVSKTATCLNNIPVVGFVEGRCGNKVVEGEEQCDCGTESECKKDACCRPDCTLSPGAQCISGACCRRCQFVPAKMMCRRRQSECDLEEYCNGTSNLCPEDVYKLDGTPCSDGAICYHGGCHSRLRQCRNLFGKEAKTAPLLCYKEVNEKVDRFGNCGLSGRGYKKCSVRDTLCGRVQCVNVMTVPSMPDHTSVIQTHVKASNTTCWGTDYHVSMHTLRIADMGDVKDGTFCGTGLICIKRTCLNMSLLSYNYEPQMCNHRGVFNNKRNCHCDRGWEPPFCETPGEGGSIDSGPVGTLPVAKTYKIWPVFIIRSTLFVALFIATSVKCITFCKNFNR
ncbi:disintegrin and metalloproteinase domain-containing protein 30-like [Ornithorhynchus anatinus]|uniref:disintegrin and metalloproteinase domain-containing protein 30-like n=1 Tax=Ornithorhynchus anatinus TaxID=9258 RepID=UPI0010A80FAE|nr:disintegrin and metalloproteinase domain-containing protein 30-like [Ornithorhynchus anatinus]